MLHSVDSSVNNVVMSVVLSGMVVVAIVPVVGEVLEISDAVDVGIIEDDIVLVCLEEFGTSPVVVYVDREVLVVVKVELEILEDAVVEVAVEVVVEVVVDNVLVCINLVEVIVDVDVDVVVLVVVEGELGILDDAIASKISKIDNLVLVWIN